MNTICYIWLMIAIGFLLLEIGHPGLFLFLSFCFGGVAAFIACFVNASLTAQLVTFLVTSFALFLILSKFSYKFEATQTKTNVYALQGKKAVVITAITSFRPGQIKYNGQVWTARAVGKEKIEKDTIVQIEHIQGVHALVKPITYKELS